MPAVERVSMGCWIVGGGKEGWDKGLLNEDEDDKFVCEVLEVAIGTTTIWEVLGDGEIILGEKRMRWIVLSTWMWRLIIRIKGLRGEGGEDVGIGEVGQFWTEILTQQK